MMLPLKSVKVLDQPRERIHHFKCSIRTENVFDSRDSTCRVHTNGSFGVEAQPSPLGTKRTPQLSSNQRRIQFTGTAVLASDLGMYGIAVCLLNISLLKMFSLDPLHRALE